MKSKFLWLPVLFAFSLTGCDLSFNQGPQEEKPQDNQQSGDNQQTGDNQQPGDGTSNGDGSNTNGTETKSSLNDVLYKAYLNYSDLSNISAINAKGEIKDFNLGLDVFAEEETMLGRNQVELEVSDFSGKSDSYITIDEEHVIEGMIQASEVQGTVAIDAALMQPIPDVEPTVEPKLRGEPEPDEPDEPDEPEFEGLFVKGEVEIAPLAVNAYIKDGNVYLDYSDEGVEKTLDNAGELAYQISGIVEYLSAMFADEGEEETEVSVPVEPKLRGEPEVASSLDLNILIDLITGAPDRKIYATIEDGDELVLDDELFVAPSEQEKAEAKESIDKFVEETLPSLKAAQLISVDDTKEDGSYTLGISLDKSKVELMLLMVEAMQQMQSETSSTLKRGEDLDVPPTLEPEEQISYAELFHEYCNKFDVDAEITLDKDGFIRVFNIDFDIEASGKDIPLDYNGVEFVVDIDLATSGKVSSEYKYNSEATFAYPNDLDQYVFVGEIDA